MSSGTDRAVGCVVALWAMGSLVGIVVALCLSGLGVGYAVLLGGLSLSWALSTVCQGILEGRKQGRVEMAGEFLDSATEMLRGAGKPSASKNRSLS